MKSHILCLALCISTLVVPFAAVPLRAAEQARRSEIDETTRFIFYSVLEGLYEDGLSKEDVGQILMRREKETYFHFILACPVCNPTIWVLEAYQARPDQFYGMKRPGSTFGQGLTPELREQLYSKDPTQRLTAINSLVQTWMERRMKNLRLSADERTALTKQLELKREEGMKALERFRKKQHGENLGVEQAAPAYVDLTECAVCNGAVGKPMKLPKR
ncbi:MAG: hypothetical protein ABMA01_01585 [Chthoniobacteraceae bacterium]